MRAAPALIRSLVMMFLATSTLHAAEEEVEPTTTMEGRNLVVFIDKPVPLIEGVEPSFPDIAEIIIPENEVEGTEQLQSINQYNVSIQNLEVEGGAWNGALIETLAGLGNLQQELRNHGAALASFDRAMHISRINNGLHNQNQIPLVNEIIESNLAIGNWEQADLYYDYLFFVQQKSFGLTDPRIIPILEDLGNWNMRAFTIGYGDVLGLRLSTAQLVFDAAARLIGSHYGRVDERFIPFNMSLAKSAFQVAMHPALINEMDRPDILGVQDNLRRALNESGSALPMGFRKGEMALEQVIAYYEEQEVVDIAALAEARTNLADWYLIFERRRDAEALYLEIWNQLSEQEDGAELQAKLFGSPIQIPTYNETPRRINLRGSERPDRGQLLADYGDFSFEVSRWGEVRRVELISEETIENAGQLRRVAREMRRIYFRPMLVDGVPVMTEDNRVRVRFWY